MLAIPTIRTSSGLTSYLLACLLAIIVAGCGGGPGSDIEESATSTANRAANSQSASVRGVRCMSLVGVMNLNY